MARPSSRARVPLPFGIGPSVVLQAIREVDMEVVTVTSVTTGIDHMCLVTWAEDGNGERVAVVLAVVYGSDVGGRLGIGQQIREANAIPP